MAPPALTGYCLLDPDITDILMDKVRFSDSLHGLSPDNKNKGNISLAVSAISMSENYYGYRKQIEFVFENTMDLTEYKVYVQSDTGSPKNMIHIATGKTSADLSVANLFDIDKDGWSGSATAMDSSHTDHIIMVTNSHISIAMAERLKNDVDAEIDQALREESLITTPEGDTIPDDLYFVVLNKVPRQIKIASAHFAAFRIINNVFKASRSMVGSSGKEEMKDEDFITAYQWLKAGVNALKKYIAVRGVQGGNRPIWSATEPMSSSVGVIGQLHGTRSRETSGDYTVPATGVDDPSIAIQKLMGGTISDYLTTV